MSNTKDAYSFVAQSLSDYYSTRQKRVMTFPDDQQRAAYRKNRGSDYLTARGANPLTGLITPSVDMSADEHSSGSRTPSPTRNSNPYPDLRPQRSRFSRAFNKPEPPPPLRPPRDDQFEALPLIVDEQLLDDRSAYSISQHSAEPLRGSGRRIRGPRRQPPNIKPDDYLCCMNVPRTTHKPKDEVEDLEVKRPLLRSPEGSRSASLPLLATKLHLTPPPSPRLRRNSIDEDRERKSMVSAREPAFESAPRVASKDAKTAPKRTSMLAQLWDKRPRIQLVHPSQAATPKALRTKVPFAYKLPKEPRKRKPAKIELDVKQMLFWIFVGYPGMLVWEISQVFQQAAFAKGFSRRSLEPRSPDKSVKEAGLFMLKVIVAAFLICYLYRVLIKLWEVFLALLWPLELLWSFFWNVSRSLVRR